MLGGHRQQTGRALVNAEMVIGTVIGKLVFRVEACAGSSPIAF
jgi:hypothetical protein